VSAVKEAMLATYRAIHCAPNPPPLDHVGASSLAQRRGINRPTNSTEV